MLPPLIPAIVKTCADSHRGSGYTTWWTSLVICRCWPALASNLVNIQSTSKQEGMPCFARIKSLLDAMYLSLEASWDGPALCSWKQNRGGLPGWYDDWMGFARARPLRTEQSASPRALKLESLVSRSPYMKQRGARQDLPCALQQRGPTLLQEFTSSIHPSYASNPGSESETKSPHAEQRPAPQLSSQ